MPGFDVTPAELQVAAALLSQVGDDARIELARLGADAGALLEGGWRGPAALSFQHGWTQWARGAGEIFQALEAMAQLLGATGQGYRAADADSGRAAACVDGWR